MYLLRDNTSETGILICGESCGVLMVGCWWYNRPNHNGRVVRVFKPVGNDLFWVGTGTGAEPAIFNYC